MSVLLALLAAAGCAPDYDAKQARDGFVNLYPGITSAVCPHDETGRIDACETKAQYGQSSYETDFISGYATSSPFYS